MDLKSRLSRPVSWADSESAQKMAQSAPLRSFGAQFEATPGPGQFQVREAILHFPQGRLRIE
eukprot:15433805-Alexandrium_andersonii.AAC.1